MPAPTGLRAYLPIEVVLRPKGAHEPDWERWGAALAVSGALLLAVALHFELPLPRCPWKLITGLPCPACGSTRAMIALLHGAPLEALGFNPLAVLGAVVAALVIVYGLVAGLTGWRRPRLGPVRSPRRFRIFVAVVVVANWIFLWRNGI